MSEMQPIQQPEQILVTLGHLSFSEHWMVTQNGAHELRGAQLVVTDSISFEAKIPVWAIILAIIFFPLGLLFLFVSEQRVVPAQLVTISKGTLVQTVSLPCSRPHVVAENHAKVSYVRTLIAAK